MHFSAQSGSGLSVTEYLRCEGLSSSAWYYWRKKIGSVSLASGKHLVPVHVLASDSNHYDCRVALRNGLALEVASGGRWVDLVRQLEQMDAG